MTHTFAHFIGAAAGSIAIMIAVYLQMLVKRRCKWEYIMLFYGVGVIVLLGNVSVIDAPERYTASVMAVGYSALIILELVAGYWVYQKSAVESPSELLNDMYDRYKQ